MKKFIMSLFLLFILSYTLFCPFCLALSPTTILVIPKSIITPLEVSSLFDFIDISIKRYESLFTPFSKSSEEQLQKRFLHMKKVIEMYYYFVREDWASLYKAIPESSKDVDFQVYADLMKILKSKFDSLSLLEQVILQEATILHDIGYIGKNWTHNQRGYKIAFHYLQGTPLAPVAESISNLILQHGDWSDIGVDSFPEELFSRSVSEQIQIMLITFFDAAGKINGNIMNAAKIKIFLELESILNRNPSLFYLFRFQHLLSPYVFSDLGNDTQESILKHIKLLFSHEGPENLARFITHWNEEIKVFIYPIFQQLYNPLKPEETLHLFLKFTKIVSQMASALQNKNPLLKKIILDSEIDIMQLNDSQRKPYMDFLKKWLNDVDLLSSAYITEKMNSSPCNISGLAISYDVKEGTLFLNFSEQKDYGLKQVSFSA